VKFSAIWCTQRTTAWAASQDMTKYALINRLHQYASANIPLHCITGYQDGNLVNFAALWRWRLHIYVLFEVANVKRHRLFGSM